MAEEERNGGVDSIDLDDLYSSFLISDTDFSPINLQDGDTNLEEDYDHDNIDVISNMGESYFPPISPQRKVNVLRRRKKSSSGADTLVAPNPDGQEEEDGEIDVTAEGEILFPLISPQRNFIFGSGVTNSEPLGIPKLHFSGTARRRIRLQNSRYPIEPNESTIDPEAVRSSTDDPDHRKEPPSLTGLSSQSQNVTRSLIAEVNKYLEWVFILTNLVLEILLVVLDQIACPQKPQYALTALALSLVAITVSVIELSFKARKQAVILRRQGMRFWFEYPSLSHKPFYNFIDVFGFICALCQFIFSAVAYSYHSQHADNPINISIVSLLFIICLASSKLTKDSKEAPVSAPV